MSQKLDLPKGAHYVEGFISTVEHDRLLRLIDQQKWEVSPSRRVQQYGYRYDFDSDAVLPPVRQIPRNIQGRVWFDELPIDPNQVLVNEYNPGEGTRWHIDHPDQGHEIAVISLGSPIQMDFRCKDKVKDVLLEPRSLLVLSGPAREKWEHCIKARKKDKKHGVTRSRRVSVTLREVVLGV